MYTGLTFVFDIDGTICPIKQKKQEYIELVPYKDMVDKIREYKAGGAKIVLFTSRNMNSYNGNIGMINANTAKIMLEWLDKWSIPYDEIIYGKPWPGHRGFYVDDRSIRPDEFLKYSEDELNEICKKSKEEYGHEN
jgi:capsule biosynthesis phosphatase